MDVVCAAYCAEGPLESPPDTTQKKEQKIPSATAYLSLLGKADRRDQDDKPFH